MNLYQPTVSGSLVISGSIIVSGSINATQGITASFSGNATSASFAQTASFVQTAQTASFVTTAQTASSIANLSQNVQITGSLTTTGQIIAQTLNVQQVTSSIVFSSGSNVFGSSVGNTQQMTGSVTVTGSFAVATTGTELQVTNTGVRIGNVITDVHPMTGSLLLSGSFGLNKAVPQRQYTQVANTNGIVFTIQNAAASNEGYIVGFDTTGSTYAQLSNSANSPAVYLNSSGSSYFTGGNVGIGATNPTNRLEVIGVSGSTGIITPLYIRGWNATTNVGGTETSYGGIQLTNNVDTTLAMRLLGSGHVQLSTDSSGRFISFGTDSFVERMRIASGGNVGINTINPRALLDVRFNADRGIRMSSPGVSTESVIACYQGDVSNNIRSLRLAGDNIYFNTGDGTDSAGTQRMAISSTGVITEPSQPVAIGALVSDQSISATTFTTLNYDTGTGYFARNINSAWNNSTRTFTAPATGTYVVGVSLLTNCIGQVAMFVNGGRTISIVSGLSISSSTTWNGECMVYLTSGDALTLRGYGENSGTLFANGFHTWFQIRFLG